MVLRERLGPQYQARDIKTGTFRSGANADERRQKVGDFILERSEIAAYRSLNTLPMKAGVNRFKLVKLVAKELADNALDSGGTASIELCGNGFIVKDDGPGIDPEQVPVLFSVVRNPRSSKYLRKPTRGAVGNGLRVVVGAVLASHGTLTVSTRGRRLVLEPQETDGTTRVVSDTPWNDSGTEVEVTFGPGTGVEITFGPALMVSETDLEWAEAAIAIGNKGTTYKSRSSPHWYDEDAFFELINAAGERPVRQLISQLDGCAGIKVAGEITSGFERRLCRSITRQEAAELLRRSRKAARPVTVKRLGAVGRRGYFPGYAREGGTMTIGNRQAAKIPFLVECWAKLTRHHSRGRDESIEATCFLNRTPATGEVGVTYSKFEKTISVGSQASRLAVEAARGSFTVEINIVSPFIPHTSEGKHASLSPMALEIAKAMGKALRAAHRAAPKPARLGKEADEDEEDDDDKPASLRDEVYEVLDEAIDSASSQGRYRFNQRQLFYAVRAMLLQRDLADRELKDTYFAALITDYEADYGDIPGMFRKPRGFLLLPHRGGKIPIGTLMVEGFKRPEWSFNKLLFVEKTGIADILEADGWHDRNDCAILAGEGFSTRAHRDLIDLLAETDEPITVFCLHDADAYGTTIYDALTYATKARGARKIEIVNLGLEPWQAIEMDLIAESFEPGKRRRPVGQYVRDYDEDDEDWGEWLQSNRVELNAMRSEQLIAFLDERFAKYDGKLVPPAEVVVPGIRAAVREGVLGRLAPRIRPDLAAEIKQLKKRMERLEAQRMKAINTAVNKAMKGVKIPDDEALRSEIGDRLDDEPDRQWRAVVPEVGQEIAESVELDDDD
jgi:hypothetical protein